MKLTVLCVYKSGGAFTVDYVDTLRRQVERSISLSYEFVCISDKPVSGCRNILMEYDFPGKWCKMEMFRPDLSIGDKVLYLDLDVVILRRINSLVKEADFTFRTPSDGYKTRIVPETGKQRICRYSSAVICFTPQSRPEIWDSFDTSVIEKYVGDQDYLGDIVPDENTFSEQEALKYRPKKHSVHPPDTRIVVFSEPRPHELVGTVPWVERCWR